MFDLAEDSMGVKFYMFFDSVSNELLVSLPADKLLFKFNPRTKPLNISVVAGNGQGCKGNNFRTHNVNEAQ